MSLLANAWVAKGRKVTVLTILRGDPAYPVDPAVNRCSLALPGPSTHFAQRLFRGPWLIWTLRRRIRDSHPDIVISFMDRPNIFTLMATRGMHLPVVICERVDPSCFGIGWVWHGLRGLLYRYADALVCQTDRTLNWFQQRIPVTGKVIPNPVCLPPEFRSLPKWSETQKQVLVAAGRFVPEKGFDLLLQAFSRIASRHPDWQLKILGDGPLKHELVRQAQSLKLEGQVEFSGTVSDPFTVFSGARLFVLSSRCEGFPNALCEAMACGLPAIAFCCSPGPAEIIRDQVDGLLVPALDVEALAAALDRLMKDGDERKRLAARAPEVLERFSMQKILSLWECLFDELVPAARSDHLNGHTQ